MIKRQKPEYRVGIGATSMLMIFTVLCLTTLSVLSLSSAQIDRATTERSRQMIAEYYAAVNRVQCILAQVDGQLAEAQAAGDDAEYAARIETISADGAPLSWIEEMRFTFAVDAGFDRLLRVEVRIAPHGADGARYFIERHALVVQAEWETQQDLFLYF